MDLPLSDENQLSSIPVLFMSSISDITSSHATWGVFDPPHYDLHIRQGRSTFY